MSVILCAWVVSEKPLPILVSFHLTVFVAQTLLVEKNKKEKEEDKELLIFLKAAKGWQ